ncbi:hypothetical protein DKE52_010775 [Acinetobacter pittii]|uniref:Uncharacterized protein n=1 Tax=Acinetobacter pittii TaxID=48296 RepID=A0A3G6YJX0_ACIPI|nr:hypothetical protein DKE52_010775 [Acinetobacter pittii]
MTHLLLKRQLKFEFWSMEKKDINAMIKKTKRDNYHILYFRIGWSSLGPFILDGNGLLLLKQR